MKRLIRITVFVTLLPLMWGCVSEFEPEGLSGYDRILVVEGFITDDRTEIKLSYATPMADDIPSFGGVAGAGVYVEIENGETIKPYGGSAAPGTYIFHTGELDFSRRYRLRIELDGEEYVSEFLHPVTTPLMDGLELFKSAPGEMVQLRVTSPGQEGSEFYIWGVTERWEFHTELNAAFIKRKSTGVLDPNLVTGPDGTIYDKTNLETSFNIYYCWGMDTPPRVFTSADKNEGGAVKAHPIVEIDPSDRKLSLLYHVGVTQNCIRKPAYDYFESVRKNSRQTGDIFSPIPSEVKGNINCLTSPGKPVIGYVEVSTTTRMEKFFPLSEDIYEPAEENCLKQISEEEFAGSQLYDIIAVRDMYTGVIISAVYKYAPRRCVDCTAWENASKAKPEWWPTDNL